MDEFENIKEVQFDFNISTRYIYHVTDQGQVFRTDTRNNKVEECFYHMAHGYKRIRVTDIDTGTRRYVRVSRLVALYFVENPNPLEYDIVNHIDGNKLNNKASNLEWCNVSINTQHAYDNNLVKDRGGWISTPYKERIKNKQRHDNTEGSTI